MIDTSTHAATQGGGRLDDATTTLGHALADDARHGDDVVSTRPRVPTPTFLTSGPQETVDAAMAALSDALERSLQEDLASGMVPTVEQLALDVVTEERQSVVTYIATALLLVSFHRV
jgi:hypothetical protein